jgi:hypothetical protein
MKASNGRRRGVGNIAEYTGLAIKTDAAVSLGADGDVMLGRGPT